MKSNRSIFLDSRQQPFLDDDDDVDIDGIQKEAVMILYFKYQIESELVSWRGGIGVSVRLILIRPLVFAAMPGFCHCLIKGESESQHLQIFLLLL